MASTGGTVHLFGVRHHGPGSARSLKAALTALAPACILIEGPPEANDLLSLASHPGLEPPVALLIYPPQSTREAVLYPFASFSPEWQAIRFARSRGLPVRFIDLSPAQQLEAERADEPPPAASRHADPLAQMARAAGYSDTERWWDRLVESRSGDDRAVFEAVHEMMGALRAELDDDAPLVEQRREAHMRQCIRAARAEGFGSIAVVCGAYHTPALAKAVPTKEDSALLKGLPRSKWEAAWVPWSYERLSIASGYGAGIESPLWYELLWERRATIGPAWITRAARLLREADVPISSAHVIETCRLADTLSALRDHPIPGLPEYADAALSVLGSGEARNLAIIARRWHFDARLGRVPEDFPAAPLQQDLAAQQKRLRLPPSLETKTLELDLREDRDRGRSLLLRRLRILGIGWGTESRQRGSRKGSFHESWELLWQPELTLRLIDASQLGHTVEQAAATALIDQARSASRLPELVGLLHDALLAQLPAGLTALVAAIQNEAASSTDVPQLLTAIPPLVEVQRYGNVRGTDTALVAQILAGLVPRMLIGLPAACTGIDEDAAQSLRRQVLAADRHLTLLADDAHLTGWRETLRRLATGAACHPLLGGCALRLLHDAHAVEAAEMARLMSLALSAAAAPAAAAAWIEGLLSGGGALLVHDEPLRRLIDDWVRGIPAEHFVQTLPLMRRSFAQIDAAERRLLGRHLTARDTPAAAGGARAPTAMDVEAARAVLPLLALIWSENDE